MSNIREIKNISDLEHKLSESELARYNSFANNKRKMQYLLAHAMVFDLCGENVSVDENGQPKIKSGFISIAHKDDVVIVAICDCAVGIDIENIDVVRDFAGQSELIGLKKTDDKMTFYRNFTQYEARVKCGIGSDKIKTVFYKMDNYLISVCCKDTDIQFINYNDLGTLAVPRVFE